MRIWDCFPSKYVSAGDLKGQDVNVTIVNCQMEEVSNESKTERKPVLYFAGMEKGMVLNVVNTQTIVNMYGEETETWKGCPITLYPTETTFGKEVKPCIRIRSSPPSGQQSHQQQASPHPTTGAHAGPSPNIQF